MIFFIKLRRDDILPQGIKLSNHVNKQNKHNNLNEHDLRNKNII